MALREIRIENLRCLSKAVLEPAAGLNLLIGANGSGKTSALEAIYVLGRGRSFRAPQLGPLIRTGQSQAVLFGELDEKDHPHRIGLRVESRKTELHIDGEPGAALAELVAALPVQLIDPQVHDLVQGGPGERRRFLDWGVFHVKHDFLPSWRRYRRAQQQRNTALRQGASPATVTAWDPELIAAGETVERLRREYLDELIPIFADHAAKMQLKSAKIVYLPGYSEGSLATALASGRERDITMGATQAGPHRAELRLEVDDEQARHRLSRGQQKLLGASMVLAQVAHLTGAVDRRMVLLVDEPAAELDGEYLQSLIAAIQDIDAQVFITALRDDSLPLESDVRLFHVERGEIGVLI
ncbi:MAG: DNA replication/repair protein RecF [Gammaproteobacteria bacterium]|nr:DNA replication/repair protein RecF [Gammaproteobacteria bacterium]